MILSSGTTFGPYEIVGPLGRGGMGEVYHARDARLGRDVALKVLREEDAEDADLLTRFEREARAASSLNHPNIVVVYEAGAASVPGRESPIHYLAMELIDGEPMSASLGGRADASSGASSTWPRSSPTASRARMTRASFIAT